MPSKHTIMEWQRDREDFALAIERAREHRADAHVEKISDYANQVVSGKLDPTAARVAIDALRWVASKENHRRYGDKIQSEVAVKIGIHTESVTETRQWID